MSPKPEHHQNEIHFLTRRISVDNFGWHVELDQRYGKSLLDANQRLLLDRRDKRSVEMWQI